MIRPLVFAAALAGTIAGAGCEAGPMDRSGFERFVFAQEPAEGFFVELSLPQRVVLERTPGGFSFDAVLLRPRFGAEASCFDGGYGVRAHATLDPELDCLESVALPARTLAPNEAVRVRAAFARVERLPVPDRDCGDVDPGGVRTYRWDGDVYTDFFCSDHAIDAAPIDALLRDLAAGSSPSP